jgi:hypothetical protein
MTVIGLISDTHGVLRPQVASALKGVSHIMHAGDVGKPEILHELASIAPVTAVRGNVDYGGWAGALPERATLSIGGHVVHMLHNLRELAIDPALKKVSVVVSGHTHKPHAGTNDGVLYFNPGSAGPRRFSLPVSVGFLRLAANCAPESWIQNLEV